MNMLSHFWTQRCCYLLAALLATSLGCGPKQKADPNRTTVSGNVTFDGKPLRGGNITFALANGNIASTVSLNEGHYSTNRVPIGLNQVSIETESLKYGSPGLYVKIPDNYTDPTKSGLQAEIKPGENKDVNFELKK
jgi:hypothetical protein